MKFFEFNQMKKPSKILLAVLVLVVLIFGAIKIFGKKANQPQYQTAKVERTNLVATVSSSGQIISSGFVNVTTQATGIIKKIYVKEGEKVKAGQKILEISLDIAGKQKSESAYSSYLSAKNSLESAKATLWSLDSSMWAANQKFINDAVSRGLAETDPTYIQQHDDWLAAEAKYKNQLSAISQAERAVTNTWLSYLLVSPVVTAPMEGTVASLSCAEGMILSGSDSTQRLAVIRVQDTPLAQVNLSEIDVPKIQPGQKATLEIDSLPGKTFTGKVVSIDKIGTVSSGVTNYPAIIRLDTSSPDLLPNMSITANIILETKENVLVVPSSAIQTQGDQSLVRVLRNGKEQNVFVETGLSSATQTEIISGLEEGDTVIIGTLSKTSNSTQRVSSPFGQQGGMFRMMR